MHQIPRRIQHEDSDSDIEVSSISSIDSPVTSDDEEENQDQQWTPNFIDFQVSFLLHKNNILFDISLYLTLSQTTNFTLFQTERGCRRQF